MEMIERVVITDIEQTLCASKRELEYLVHGKIAAAKQRMADRAVLPGWLAFAKVRQGSE